MATGEPYPGTQAVLRALSLLKSFTDEQPQLSLADLSARTHLNKTTVYRLLTALESEGLVMRNGDGGDSYRLGPEAIVLGGRAIRANNLRTVSRPELEALARQTRETATVEVLWAEQVFTLDEVSGGYLVGAAPTIGSQWPLHATSTGKLLLAYQPPAEQETLLHQPLTPYTSKTITGPQTLSAHLEQIRSRGYAVGDEELEIGFVSVAVPVRNYEDRVVAALSVGGASARLTPARITELAALLEQAAGRISANLGYRPSDVAR